MNYALPQSRSWHEGFKSYWTSILTVLITSVASELYQISNYDTSYTADHSKVARHPWEFILLMCTSQDHLGVSFPKEIAH